MDVLIKKAKDGDRRAFEEIVRRTYVDSYTLAFRMLRNEEDARDVVQETYLKAQKGLKKFRGDAKISTWLYRITANCANTHLVRQRKHRHDELSDQITPIDTALQHDPERRGVSVGLRAELKAALEELPPKLRSVVVLRDVYDLSHSDIARELKITEAAAKVRLHRGRFKLREKLYPTHREGRADAV